MIPRPAIPRRAALLLLVGGLGGALAGCGGGSGGSGGMNPEASTAKPAVNVEWPARTRGLAAPDSAAWVGFAFLKPGGRAGDPAATVLSYLAVRPTPTGASSQTYVVPKPIPVGQYDLDVTFRTEAHDVVGAVRLAVGVDKEGTLTRANGEPLGTVAYEGQIAQVRLEEGQVVTTGGAKDLLFTALTSAGAAVPVAYGAAHFEVLTGADHLQIDANGSATGLTAGEATVRATIDGKISPTQTVLVEAPPLVPRVVPFDGVSAEVDPLRGKLWIYANAQPTLAELRSLDLTTLYQDKPIVGLSHSADIDLSDDGSAMALSQPTRVGFALVNLLSGGQSYIRVSGQDPFASAPAFAPASSSTLALGIDDLRIDDSSIHRVVVYDGATPRPNEANVSATPTFLAWNGPNRLLAKTSQNVLYVLSVDANGVTSVGTRATLSAGRFEVAAGRVYGANGAVYDAETLAPLGAFPLPSGAVLAGPAIDVAANRAWFVVDSPTGVRLTTYRLDDFSLLESRRLQVAGGSVAEPQRLFRWKNKGLVFAAAPNGLRSLVILGEAPGL